MEGSGPSWGRRAGAGTAAVPCWKTLPTSLVLYQFQLSYPLLNSSLLVKALVLLPPRWMESQGQSSGLVTQWAVRRRAVTEHPWARCGGTSRARLASCTPYERGRGTARVRLAAAPSKEPKCVLNHNAAAERKAHVCRWHMSQRGLLLSRPRSGLSMSRRQNLSWH